MRETAFFVEKATEYRSAIENILSKLASSTSWNTYDSTVHKTLQNEIIVLTLKTKLLLSEFDKGDLFITELKKADERINNFESSTSVELLKYTQILTLFIEHLNTFRNDKILHESL
jgi:hypothetical protein